VSDDRTQGRKANDAGAAADGTVREHLATHAGLIGVSKARTLRGYESEPIGYMGSGRGDYCEDVRVCDDGAFALPFVAHYAVRRRDWPQPLLVFVHSQNDSGSAENAVLRFLWNLSSHRRCPGVIVLLGDRWEKPDAAPHVQWIRDRRSKLPSLLRVFPPLPEPGGRPAGRISESVHG
jgi:hypothetical protein